MWALLILLKINPMLREKSTPLFIFLIIYGALIILYDLFGKRQSMDNRYFILVFLLLLLMGISVLVNFPDKMVDNVKIYITTAISFLLISRAELEKNKDQLRHEMGIINTIIIVGVSIATFISLYLFFKGINGIYDLDFWRIDNERALYQYGLSSENRLVGIFTNPNPLGAFNTIAILLALINIKVLPKKAIYKIFFFLTIAMNFIAVILSNSRGAIYALIVSFFVFTFTFFMERFKNYKAYLNTFISLSLSLILTFTLYQAIPEIDKEIRDFSLHFRDAESEQEEIELIEERVKLAGSDDLVVRSGTRLFLWEVGFNTAKISPIFGVGKANLNEVVLKNWDVEKKAPRLGGGGLHNIYLETLVAYGILVLILLILLLSLVGIDVLVAIYKDWSSDNLYAWLGIGITIIMIFDLTRNLVESGMLYSVDLSSFSFSLYLGYAMYYAQKNRLTSKTNLVFRANEGFRNQIDKIFS